MMNLEQKIAKNRVQIKRQLRRLNVEFNSEDPTNLLEAKLTEAEQTGVQLGSQVVTGKMSIAEIMQKKAQIFNPLYQQASKKVNSMTLTELTAVMKSEGLVDRRDLIALLAQRQATPIFRKAGLL